MKSLFYSLVLAILCFGCTNPTDEQKTAVYDPEEESVPGEMQIVSFPSEDGVEVIAHYYPVENAKKLILLYHQLEGSKGEYMKIIPQLTEKGYACMAVDLRVGAPMREILNETNINAIKMDAKMHEYDAMKDMEASVAYATKTYGRNVVLWGSSYSGTLALMVGRDHPQVEKVLAFSPGVYFGSENTIVNAISGYNKPVFMSCAKNEIEQVRAFSRHIPAERLSFVEPTFLGMHGSKILWNDNASTRMIYDNIWAFLAH